MGKPKRKNLTKKLRFEVFKRDSFTCQYCGKRAPDGVLEVDHIEPVAKGGTNDILNLVTACDACNSGKGARELSDDAAVRRQMEELSRLNDRREQLKMILTWKRELERESDSIVEALADRWRRLAPGWMVDGRHISKLRTISQRHSLGTIHKAMETVADNLEWETLESGSERVTAESWVKAFSKISRVCSGLAEIERSPHMADVRHILNILKFHGHIYQHAQAMGLVEGLVESGVDPERMKRVAHAAKSLDEFEAEVLAMESSDESRIHASGGSAA